VIDKLPEEVVLQGREHPFVVELLKELKAKQLNVALAAESAMQVNPAHALGRAAALRDVIRMIEEAKGKPE
jgi:hypothetical protein